MKVTIETAWAGELLLHQPESAPRVYKTTEELFEALLILIEHRYQDTSGGRKYGRVEIKRAG